jgi:small-conductance mechanosensitive channel/CRP-like cAMP-binding protein
MPELSENWKWTLLILIVPALYWVLVIAGKRLKRSQGVRLGWLYHLFALCLSTYATARLVGLHVAPLRHLGAAVVVLGAMFLIALVDRYVWDLYFQKRHGVIVPKFLTEVVRLIILILAVFLVLEMAYDQTIRGLLIAPGIAAVVIGLAMQDLVGNIIAGIALQAGKSFAHGDWLIVEDHQAEVVEVNWRSTRLKTVDEVSIEIPNRELARLTILNLNRPTRTHAMRLPVTLDYSAPPTRAKAVLLHAAANAKGVLPEPKPRVFLSNFADSGIQYEIKFWMNDHALYSEACDAIRTNVWYGLRRHGIRIPFPTRTLQLERPSRDKQQELQSAARIILRQQPLFKCLSDDQLDGLLPRGQVVHFGQNETLIRQGDEGQSMFILVSGEANVVVERNGSPQAVAVLNAGECFGEMSLLTGERRSATVVARTDCEVVEISKTVLAQSLKDSPELLHQLSELLAKRQMDTEGILAAATPSGAAQERQHKYAATFLDKLRLFFEL